MRFGRFAIDPQRLVLELDGRALDLAPKSVEFLAALVERGGDVVSKRELFDRLWPDSDVEEANLTQHAYVIRKALRAHDPLLARAIVTVPKRGYRFLAPAVEEAAEPAPEAAIAPTFVAAAPVRRRLQARSRWILAAVALLTLVSGLGGLRAAVVRHSSTQHAPLGAAGAQMARLGRYYLDLRTQVGVRRSRDYFARVIRSDPDSATGYAGLADAFSLTADYHFGSLPRSTYLREATALATRALRLDPRSPDAHASLGEIASFSSDRRTAERELREAIALDPNYAPAHHWLGTVRFDEGDVAGSARELETALRMNPISTASSAWLETAAYFERRYDTAIDYGRRAIELDPSRYDTLRELGLAYSATRRYADALATFRRIPKNSDTYASVPFLVASVYANMGHAEVARRMLVRERGRRIVDSELVFALLAIGERRDAARAAARAHFSDCRNRFYFVRDPRFDTVRTDAGFFDVLNVRCSSRA